MNLIASVQKLDLQQEKAIYELTLKKQRSKKSTISQKQMAAMQQLAIELMTQRRDFQNLIDHNQNHIDHHPHTNSGCTKNQTNIEAKQATTQRPNDRLCRCTKSTTSSSFISTTSTASTSTSASVMSDETNIKLSQLRLEQLNNELERRLHQYEYLVAQEKALLGAYKLDLFTNESVNNFHLFHLPDLARPKRVFQSVASTSAVRSDLFEPSCACRKSDSHSRCK